MRPVLVLSLLCLVTAGTACVSSKGRTPAFAFATESVEPGTSVSRGGKPTPLSKGHLTRGEALPSVEVTDASWQPYKFASDGKVKVVSVVPSVDTKVCEEQTHVLGETSKLDPKVERVTLSRDLPAAQKRFAEEAKLTNVKYLSDFRDGSFGKASGLLMVESGLLARAVLVVDGEGKVRYMQVVPDVAKLPDMERAFAEANKLVQ